MKTNTPNHTDIDYDAIYHHASFQRVIKKKAGIITVLLVLAFISFFSLPFLNNVFPALMKTHLIGSFNVGLAWVILQYPVMGLLAWVYSKKMQQLDNSSLMKDLKKESHYE